MNCPAAARRSAALRDRARLAARLCVARRCAVRRGAARRNNIYFNARESNSRVDPVGAPLMDDVQEVIKNRQPVKLRAIG